MRSKEAEKVYQSKYRAEHREKTRAYRKEYYIAHCEEIKAKSVKWKAEHVEWCEEREARRYSEHREERIAATLRWQVQNPQKANAKGAKWRHDHPEQHGETQRRRRARKMGAPINDLTVVQWQSRITEYYRLCAYCLQPLTEVTQDHMTPLVRGGSHTLSNVVPACRSCNVSKKRTMTLLEYVISTGGKWCV